VAPPIRHPRCWKRAAVSRDARSTDREVTLSKEERDIARLSGISEQEYGRQELHMQARKAKGH
jgi:hypothetical protein